MSPDSALDFGAQPRRLGTRVPLHGRVYASPYRFVPLRSLRVVLGTTRWWGRRDQAVGGPFADGVVSTPFGSRRLGTSLYPGMPGYPWLGPVVGPIDSSTWGEANRKTQYIAHERNPRLQSLLPRRASRPNYGLGCGFTTGGARGHRVSPEKRRPRSGQAGASDPSHTHWECL